ncbi:response regulator transcription factor [Tenacibaculum sp. 190524A02b]|uniref:Transcriptional regulatory protein RprY n=1 Tax=Tenacibaculum vairaonense TaxID=3137860 RepID=A0ABP1F9D7_9FLAO
MKTKLLLVEDELTLSNLLSEFLEAEGYDVICAFDGEEGLKLLLKHSPEICIFDVMMPKISGFTLLETMRNKQIETPVLFLTARALKEDIIKGLALGADDYLTKPFNFQELNLRLKNILKRKQVKNNQEVYLIGQFTFNHSSLTLTFNNETQTLTAMEANMLHLLYTHKNKTVERKVILQDLWGNEDFFNFRSIDVFVSKLRKHLSKDENLKIVSVRGKGYRLVV